MPGLFMVTPEYLMEGRGIDAGKFKIKFETNSWHCYDWEWISVANVKRQKSKKLSFIQQMILLVSKDDK